MFVTFAPYIIKQLFLKAIQWGMEASQEYWVQDETPRLD